MNREISKTALKKILRITDIVYQKAIDINEDVKNIDINTLRDISVKSLVKYWKQIQTHGDGYVEDSILHIAIISYIEGYVSALKIED